MLRLVAAICLLVAIAGCGGGNLVQSSWPPGDLTLEHFTERSEEWRYGYKLEGGKTYEFELGAIPENGVFRYGVREGQLSLEPVRFRLLAGENVIAESEIEASGRWRHAQIDVSDSAGAGLVAQFESDEEFWVGGLELFTPSADKPNVLVILMDTLRKDRMGFYGYERDATPTFDALASESTIFENLFAQSPWTRTSIMSLFSGTYPETHGMTEHREYYSQRLPMFTKAFRDNGYYTQAFVANIGLHPGSGFGFDFDHFALRRKFVGDAVLVDLALEGLNSAKGKPWFTYVHLMGVHSPYDPPADLWDRYQPEGESIARDELHEMLFGVRNVGLGKQAQLSCTEGREEYKVHGEDTRPFIEDVIDPDRMKAIVEALYDAELRNSDAQIKRIIDTLKANGEYDNTLIIMLADHGEGFWEHGLNHHGNSLFGELLDVPFILKRPHTTESHRVEEVVEQVDIPRTIAEITGVAMDWPMQGQSLMPLVSGEGSWEPRVARSSMSKTISPRSLPYEPESAGVMHYFRSVRNDRYKIIRNDASGDEQIFDLINDPREQNPLAEEPEGIEDLRSTLDVMGSDRVYGMALMLSAPWNEDTVFTGTISGEVPESMTLRTQLPGRSIERDGDVWRFRVEIDAREDIPFSAPHYNPILFGVVEPDAQVKIEIEVNGEPMDPGSVHLGKKGEERLDASGEVVPSNYSGDFDECHPTRITNYPGGWLWFSYMSETVAPLEIDAETAEELRSLGYL